MNIYGNKGFDGSSGGIEVEKCENVHIMESTIEKNYG